MSTSTTPTRRLWSDRSLGRRQPSSSPRLQPTEVGSSRLAERIGAVYLLEDLARWLALPGDVSPTGEAVAELAQDRRLAAFSTDDGHLAFPPWQFDRGGGLLAICDAVVGLWQQLPADSFLTDVDLGGGMAAPLVQLDRAAPAEYSHWHGVDAVALHRAVAHLRSRAS